MLIEKDTCTMLVVCISPFCTMFSKAFFLRVVKTVDCVVKG